MRGLCRTLAAVLAAACLGCGPNEGTPNSDLKVPQIKPGRGADTPRVPPDPARGR